jgi:catechol 2,3-dioxygenase-like lactoylglutathione lyase family enzyme
MADLEVGGLRHTSSITKDVAKNVGFYAGVLGMRLVYRSVYFGDPSMYHLLALANGASNSGREEGPTQEELAAVRHLGRRLAEKAALLVGGRAHV